MCPKCQSSMQTVDRRGIHLDQCTSCRGIFLDRGELEQIVNAEQSYNMPAAPPAYAPPPGAPGAPGYPAPPAPGYPAGNPAYGAPAPGYPAQGHVSHGGHYRDSPPAYGHRDSPPHYGHPGQQGHYGHKKRKSFVEDLFG